MSQPNEREPDWWHRDHPTFTPIMGFFAGLLFVALIPAAFVSALNALFTDEVASGLSPLMAATLVVPVGLLVWRPTRKFGRYMVFGMLMTAVVVIGVTTLVLWLMASQEL
jgi:hypothetical protein